MHRRPDTPQWVYLGHVHIVTHIDSTARQAGRPLAPSSGKREKLRKAKMWAGRSIPGRGPF